MSTLFLTHPDCLNHVTPPGHPERVARLEAILEAMSDPAFAALSREDAPLAPMEAARKTHPQSHLDAIAAAAPEAGLISLDADTHMSPGSLTAARRAVGAAARAVDAVMADAGNAFCAVRPPGHHAERATPMGFCLFGTVAIAAKHALEAHGLERVAVVDFDVHHGNGTQDLLWDEPRIRFASTHQMPLYPGTGAAAETGAHGNVMNVPLPPHSGGAAMRAAYDDHILPWLDAFAPQLLIVSAGFDAHTDDPLAQLNWTETDFAWVTGRLCDLAAQHCGGRLVSCLEGGYDLDGLAKSVAAHVTVLMERSA
ncbi:MAG: histone deacetylase family protein [Pseudomonadota bacterium]